MEQNKPHDLDLDLYSRQLYVLGLETLKSLSKTNALLCGLRGIGVEIAKNLILAGPRSVTIHDDDSVQISEMSSQFYFKESEVGMKRSDACVSKLAELNPYVKVSSISGALTADIIKNYQVLVVSDVKSLTEMKSLNKLCRENKVAFMMCDCYGLFGFSFVDLGDNFTVTDADGEEPAQCVISSVSKENPALITIHEDKRHGLDTGDFISFEDVTGMEELNSLPPQKVTVKGSHTLEISVDATKFGQFTSGFLRQAKMPKTISFKNLDQSLVAPGEFLLSDFGKFGRAEQLHIALQGLMAFREKHGGALPKSYDDDDAKEVVSLSRSINEEMKKDKDAHSVEEIEESVVQTLSHTCRGDLNPMAAFFGGIVAQEVLKLSGKFHPLKQWFHFDSFECLPKEQPKDFAPQGSRYDGQIAVFGKQFQEHIGNQKIFLVGAGALGCEFLKNFAQVGLCAGKDGLLNLTDLDNIEKSNLNRQFLFRDRNIGQMKALAASEAAKAMNPDLKIQHRTDAVGTDTEHIFTEDFWRSNDFVVNALDNLKARLYVDSCCVLYGRPLLESGTLGTKANTQVILPFKTESYGSSRDPPESSIPMCTLKNFPYQIEHTIEWSRDVFGGLFTLGISEVNNYLKDPKFFENLIRAQPHVNSQRETVSLIFNVLSSIKTVDFAFCVQWSRTKFDELFVNNIKQLLYNFPVDHKDSSGQPFWSGVKRAPTVYEFDETNPTHIGFVTSGANLIAEAYNIPPQKRTKNIEEIKKILSTIVVAKFEPKTGVAIKESENSNVEEGASDDEEILQKLKADMPKPSEFDSGFELTPASFEKDDDSNFHIDFITYASNLRATNYNIREADRNKTKKIAGKIVPAIATTTAMITGLVGLEIYKLLLKKEFDQFRNAFVNLALPLFAMSEPMPPPKHTTDLKAGRKAVPEGWTLWDSLVIKGDKTFQELKDHFKSTYNLEMTSVAAGTSLVYNAYIPRYKSRLGEKVSDVWKKICGDSFDENNKFIDMSIECEDPVDDSLEIDMPVVRFQYKD